MQQERILAIHDISCVGRCSLTVALPIISASGIECSVLPTAVLSTHTGGFTGFTYRDLTDDLVPIDEHWMSLGLGFDAFYTGFLGSFEQIDLVKKIIGDVRNEGTTVYVDPVMADNGVLYPIFDESFPQGMRGLCECADVIIPNMTELSLMLGREYIPGPYTHEYIDSVIEDARSFGVKRIVITGVSYENGLLGAAYFDYETGEKGDYMREEIPGYYHGTGDVFGSALVAAAESGLSLGDAVKVAVDFTVGSIIRTHDAGTEARYGVNFEAGLYDLAAGIRRLTPVTVKDAVTDEDIRKLSETAYAVWRETFNAFESEEQTEYMLERLQSYEALKEQISSGFTYRMLMKGDRCVGFTGYQPRDGKMYISKIYLCPECRGLGYSGMLIDMAAEAARKAGLGKAYLSVMRNNYRAVVAYKKYGFEIVREEDTDIGGGFYTHDYIMELEL